MHTQDSHNVQKLDLWGYEVHTASDLCIDHINSYYLQVLSYGKCQKIILKAVEADSGCALALALSAAYAHSHCYRDAASRLAAAKGCLVEATPYEKMVVTAVAALVEGERDVALSAHSKVLVNFPKDLVSLKRAQVLCFYMGRSDESLKLALQVLPANEGLAYMYGMLAFPLLETCRFDDAENAAKKALTIEKNDQWAQHAFCHVLHYRCRFREAVLFMEKNSGSWNSCGSFMYSHNWWHLALLYMEWGCNHALEKVLEIYDHHIWPARCRDLTGSVQVPLNALGLLLRLELRGYVNSVRTRISAMTEHLYNKTLWHKELLLDLLAVWALASMDQSTKAQSLLKMLKSRVGDFFQNEQGGLQMFVKLAEGLYEYGRGNYEAAFVALGPSFNTCKLKAIGASDEQLDVFEELWCIVSLRSGHLEEVLETLKRRTTEMSGSPFNWKLMEDFYINKGSPDKAEGAAKRARSLKGSYLEFIEVS